MFCPNCGQERVSTETSFCSRCGFLLTGTADLLQTGGVTSQLAPASGFKADSPRNRGLKQGLFLFLLTFLVVPLISIITIFVRAEPFVVAISAILLTIGGLLRMAFALMFESKAPRAEVVDASSVQPLLNRPAASHALPPHQTYPAQSYTAPATGNWRDTNDLEPKSVTENTTKLLEYEETPQ